MEMAFWVLAFYGISSTVLGIFLVYFIIKRIQSKQNETFEKRDN